MKQPQRAHGSLLGPLSAEADRSFSPCKSLDSIMSSQHPSNCLSWPKDIAKSALWNTLWLFLHLFTAWLLHWTGCILVIIWNHVLLEEILSKKHTLGVWAYCFSLGPQRSFIRTVLLKWYYLSRAYFTGALQWWWIKQLWRDCNKLIASFYMSKRLRLKHKSDYDLGFVVERPVWKREEMSWQEWEGVLGKKAKRAPAHCG